MAEANNTIGSARGDSESGFTISSTNFSSSLGASSTAVANNEFIVLVLTTPPSTRGTSESGFTISNTNFTSSFGASSTAVTNNEFVIFFSGNAPIARGDIVAVDYGGLKATQTASYQLVEG